ncbi:hypothetical protein QBC40DRAFT_328006 [Triangularia verruculosa]|uniref:RanBP2-type domain-containing protein n=1 Tax=Triangularia verruculosa TaxID=2587418 RepID=A0AAN7AWB0_9PEZI|nr:hypothetical protein QBC40DRAFT_328006 [Triangularia verruculosa]
MASYESSIWLTESESSYAESEWSSTSSSPYSPPAFAALTSAAEQRTPSPEFPQPHGPHQVGPSLLSQGIAEMRTLQPAAAGKEKFLPSKESKPNTNNPSSQAATNNRRSTIRFPSPSQLQAQRREAIALAEQARINDETRRAATRVEERQAVLWREMEREIYVSGMCFMDMSGERRDTENAGGWDSREWVCCGCEVYNSGHEFLCSHCRVHTKCRECERREEGWFKLDSGDMTEEGESCFRDF